MSDDYKTLTSLIISFFITTAITNKCFWNEMQPWIFKSFSNQFIFAVIFIFSVYGIGAMIFYFWAALETKKKTEPIKDHVNFGC